MAVDELEIILKIAAEGGSLTLYGKRDTRSGWHFSRRVREQTPMMVNEGDDAESEINHGSGWVSTWQEAVSLLDRYPWAMLSAQHVHKEFRALVWAAVEERLHHKDGTQARRAKSRWAMICSASNGSGEV